MLSTIHERNMDITINAMSAIIPRMEDTNSSFSPSFGAFNEPFKFTLHISILNFTLVCFLFSLSYNVFHDPH